MSDPDISGDSPLHRRMFSRLCHRALSALWKKRDILHILTPYKSDKALIIHKKNPKLVMIPPAADRNAATQNLDYQAKDADITLISSDNLHFKVHGYMLKAHSAVLRDLLNDSQMMVSPIPIDVHSRDLKRFLDLMYLPDPLIPFSWIETKTLLETCDKYDCPLIHERIRTRLNPHPEQAPWETFCLASHFNDLELAKKSLVFMGRDSKRRWLGIRMISISDASQPQLPYLLGLLRTIDLVYRGQPPTPASREGPQWELVAERFQLLVE
ncbi:hypothetical protein I302_103764 [Kwoniella bestiolae CBS 10118]|uniref:BTB domain-containing protein n=1 Tax=Kwoniella bestiolae CBS 10118 TaxID=1296100 RepID=A0A1B9G9A5_9TREE|nr:hypothetical protein I302_02468 [Kwoniella bestiolae CBS 10118]OCF27625.1 hypothetical protein I302_02468 [Kwoniella bestiolae CBS 10118]